MVAAALAVQAEEQPTRLDLAHPESAVLRRNYITWDDPAWWAAMRTKDDRVVIGRSDYTVQGPIVNTFRRAPNWSDLTPAQKIISLPIVSLFVPQPMNIEPRRSLAMRDYIKWGEDDRPWSNIGDPWINPVGLFSIGF